MEDNMKVIMEELKEIKSQTCKEKEILPAQIVTAQQKQSIWFDETKLAKVKAKPAESALVINKAVDADVDKRNQELIENIVIQSKVPVVKSYKNKEGNLVVLCDSSETRDSLKTQVQDSIDNIELTTPKEKRPAVSIVGLSREYMNNEVVDLLVKQNSFIQQFAQSNDIKDHISVFAVKPIRAQNGIYQAFARISKVLRQGISSHKDRLTIGLQTCRVYDQYHIKRCNKCQSYGHYYKDCQSTPICAKCSGPHSTRDCSEHIIKCTNCMKEELPVDQCNHRADDEKCPTLNKRQQRMKKMYETEINLNF